jgi:Transglycosylase SLT domain
MIILSVLKKEGGRNGSANKNKNGTIDYGVMQINSIWLPKIAAYGYTQNDIQYDACKNVEVGTWILSQSIADGKTIWSGIGNYHSRTPDHNRIYRNGIYKNYQKLSFVLRSS